MFWEIQRLNFKPNTQTNGFLQIKDSHFRYAAVWEMMQKEEGFNVGLQDALTEVLYMRIN